MSGDSEGVKGEPDPIRFQIQVGRDAVVNEETGEIKDPAEYQSGLRELEREITRVDEKISDNKREGRRLKAAKETIVDALRAAVREGKVVSLDDVRKAAGEATSDDGNDDEEAKG